MIIVIKEFHKLSTKTNHKVGETLTFSKEDEAKIVSSGFAEYVKDDKRKKIKIDKK